MPDISLLHPKENHLLYGHDEAERIFLDSFNSGKMPHSWIISGQKGIGKATFAYRIARFLLSGGKKASGGNLFGEESSALQMDKSEKIFNRIVQGTHADLLVIEVDEEAGKTEIPVDRIREIHHFLNHTPSESEWRVVIVDSADEMNRNAANALLKSLEEPPEKTIILLVSHSPGRLLPTIRSRCRNLRLMPLSAENEMKVMKDMADGELNLHEAKFAANISAGSPGFALEIYSNEGIEIYRKLVLSLSAAPDFDIAAVQEIGASVARKDGTKRWKLTTYMLSHLLASVVEHGILGAGGEEIVAGENELKKNLLRHYSVDQLAELWEKLGRIVAETDGLNIDRKLSTMQIFGMFKAAV